MRVRMIRGVDEETWKKLKEFAKRKKVKIGTMFKILV